MTDFELSGVAPINSGRSFYFAGLTNLLAQCDNIPPTPPPPPSPSPTPSPPSGCGSGVDVTPAPCAWPSGTLDYALVVQQDCTLALANSGSSRGLAVGGSLERGVTTRDSAPPLTFRIEPAPSEATFRPAVHFPSHVHELVGNAPFDFVNGVTLRAALPFDWGELQGLATRLAPSDDVSIVDQGGAYVPADTTCDPAHTYDARTTNVSLLVFTGEGTVCISGSFASIPSDASGKATWVPTVLAPYARVLVDVDFVGTLSGMLVARSFATVSRTSSASARGATLALTTSATSGALSCRALPPPPPCAPQAVPPPGPPPYACQCILDGRCACLEEGVSMADHGWEEQFRMHYVDALNNGGR
jgi:hypothetical protein